ncbi:DUF4838 domain-containing protein [Dysgonomonas sp. 216]|uniref:DUF4838 domain-containing protein n=1 Tax=Dysgonomonas sp. 216 TaxID=2302934 RepID=UPI0013D3A0C9|nr:DUF4838 domain-containing protein [Dysgonomonas sp. 216]NDW18485.1 DUF4838 domain-containing protein [Dysgonomonas sp. 216]
MRTIMVKVTEAYIIYIFSYMLTSKNYIKLLFLFSVVSLGCSGGVGNSALKSDGYCILNIENRQSIECADYMFRELNTRTKGENIVQRSEISDGYKSIEINVDENLPYDYSVEHKKDYVKLNASSKKTMLWLAMQIVKLMANCDGRIVGDDLPPAVINCSTQQVKFDFEYREPYFRPNLQEKNNVIYGTNSVELDWGIWGHNLNVALENEEEENDNAVYAKQNNNVVSSQYCFSNEVTFKRIKEYIVDNFGFSKTYRQHFMIMPNDNAIACNCELCAQKGNTSNNATPAVSDLVIRLAKEFPFHTFFTSAYLTTKYPPNVKWPSNTGVMISTIDLPKGVALENGKSTEEFLKILKNWSRCTSKVYIWDYAANFDDYLTPIPVLKGLKKQLEFYKSEGVDGVFLNASGYDYSPFDDLKSYVAAALMMNTNLSVDSLCSVFFDSAYPVSGRMLKDYYLLLEDKFEAGGKPYNMYGGFKEISDTYLDIRQFVEMYDSLDMFIGIAENEEKAKLEKLRTALSYTRLQVAYFQKGGIYGYAHSCNKVMIVKPYIDLICNRLAQHSKYKDLNNYKESDGAINDYLRNWAAIRNNDSFTNLLTRIPLRTSSKLDDGYDNIRLLNDGVLGFDNDYHQGWMIISNDDLEVTFESQSLKLAKKLEIRFLNSNKHRLYAPEKVMIYKNNVLYKEIQIQDGYAVNDNMYTVCAKADVDVFDADNITIKILRPRNEGKNAIACDEIRLY